CHYLTTTVAQGSRLPLPATSAATPPAPHDFTPPTTNHGGGTFASTDEVRLAHELGKLGIHASIRLRWLGHFVVGEDEESRLLKAGERIDTTTGRVLFNAQLPSGLPFYNFTLTAKRLGRILADCQRRFGRRRTVEVLDQIKQLGFDAATRSGVSFATDD